MINVTTIIPFADAYRPIGYKFCIVLLLIWNSFYKSYYRNKSYIELYYIRPKYAMNCEMAYYENI
jgi:hypothetical protein